MASTSEPKAVAGAIATRLRNKEMVRVTVMGPGSVNQATKALAVVRDYLVCACAGASLDVGIGILALNACTVHPSSQCELALDVASNHGQSLL